MPPINDNVADAIELTGSSGTVYGDNTGATSEPYEADYWYGVDPDYIPSVWYYYLNSSSRSAILTVSNPLIISGFISGDGSEIDGYSFGTGTASSFENLINVGTQEWYMYFDSTPTEYTRSLTIPAGHSGYIWVGNWDYVSTDFGAFKFDWEVSIAPVYPAISMWLHPPYKVA